MNPDRRDQGTCFLLYPQAPVLAAYSQPERVYLSSPLGSIEPGPQDERAYAVDAIEKRRPYEFPYLPPWSGPALDPVAPGPDGHFDHLQPGTRDFATAHLFGAVRHTLDVWEGYLGRPIQWHFRRDFARLELVPLLDWNNAHSGYGFVETGWDRDRKGRVSHFALNHDTIAHELGHSILFSEVGIPVAGHRTAEFLAFHEALADLIALICSMRFDTVLDHVLRVTHGNLYVENEINRIAELSESEQIRVASQSTRMAEVEDIALDSEGEWYDPSGRGRHAHDLGLPLLGAIFDLLVEIYEEALVARGLIRPQLDELSRSGDYEPRALEQVAAGFALAYAGRHEDFKEALIDARDYLGFALARAIEDLWPQDLTFTRVGGALLAADAEMTGGQFWPFIQDSFAWRGIRLPRPTRRRHIGPGELEVC